MTVPLAVRTAALAVASAVALLGCPVVAAAAPTASAPQLSISIDDGHAAASAGDRLDYTITVANQGSATVRGLTVDQSVPIGMRLVTAKGADQQTTTRVQWRETLTAGQSVVLHTTLEVGATPRTLLRLATVTCARLAAKAPPLVCATDSDVLPAGAAASATQARASTAPSAPAGPTHGWWYAAAVAALLLLTGAGVVLLRRRGKRPDDSSITPMAPEGKPVHASSR